MNNILLSFSLTFGVMLCISITDLIPESLSLLSNNGSTITICFYSLLFIIIGVIFSMLIDYYLPTEFNNNNLYKLGIISMLAIILHNMPGGCNCYVSQQKYNFSSK